MVAFSDNPYSYHLPSLQKIICTPKQPLSSSDFQSLLHLLFQVALLLKVAKTNFVVAKLAAGGHKKDSVVGN